MTYFLANPLLAGRVRQDRRCGRKFPLPDGSGLSECDPGSKKPCCSKWGYCGPGADHCDCDGCIDYRSETQKAGELRNGKNYHP
jgi:hypothetical protein